MKRKISDLLDAYSETELKIEKNTPLSSERIRELTMSKITKKEQKPRHIAFRVLAAAAIIAMMTLSVFAAGNGLEWFRAYFAEHSNEALSEGQIEFIDGNTVEQKQSQTINGYTVTLESYISDGRNSYFKFNVQAPEGEELPKIIFDHRLYENDDWIWGYSSVWSQLDGDEETGTGCYLLTLKDVPVEMDGLELRLTNMEYYDDVGCVLAEGIWSFVLDVPDTREIELAKDPVAGVLCKAQEGAQFEVLVTSARLRAMNLEIQYEECVVNDYSDHEFDAVKVIMADGSSVVLNWHGSRQYTDDDGVHLSASFDVKAPLELDQVTYVEFPGGIRIPVGE